jgi:hypothetical protein
LRLFTEEEGAQVPSQVTTLRLAQRVVFDWQDESGGRMRDLIG